MYRLLTLITIISLFVSCKKLDTFQQIHSLKQAQWQYDNPLSFTFNIEDTTAEYHHYIILRTDDNFDYSNVWVKVLIQSPSGEEFTDSFLHEFILFDKNGYSYGEQQGTFWNYKMPVIHKRLQFHTPGEYTIQVKQFMRDDELKSIFNVGWCIEKK